MQRSVFLRSLAAVAAAATLALPAVAAESKATKKEAEAMVGKAVAYLKANGPDKAWAEFTNGASFKDRDLYVFAYDMSGKALAHGANAKLVGKDLSGMKDPDGKLPVKMGMDLAASKGKGWTDEFKFRNPVTNELQRRVVYLERVGEHFIGAGVFLD